MGDNDSYCDSEASIDDGSCYDNLEDVASPPPSDLSHQTLDLRHQDVSIRVRVVTKNGTYFDDYICRMILSVSIIIIHWLFQHLIIFSRTRLINSISCKTVTSNNDHEQPQNVDEMIFLSVIEIIKYT